MPKTPINKGVAGNSTGGGKARMEMEGKMNNFSYIHL
jgi:hypothetical protein